MKLIPLGDKVVLKQMVAEETTKSGIVLTGSAKEKPQQAEVVAVGPGTDEVKMQVKVGDKVICTKYAGTEVKLDGDRYALMQCYTRHDRTEKTQECRDFIKEWAKLKGIRIQCNI